MQGYDFHVHGKPYSQDIWKNDAYSDYLNGLYSDAYLKALPDESYMIIEIHNRIVHYTYMRSKEIRDNIEREGSFFAITVSFKEQFCSVIALYNLLDQIYNRIAKPSFFVPSKTRGCLKYKVLQLEDANVAEQMLMAFDKNVMYLNIKDMNYQFDTLHSKETKIVSLKDVDSPEFVDMLLRNRIFVSPLLNSAVKRCGAIECELATLKTQKQTLLSSNEQLQSEIGTLTEENKSLSSQLHASASSTEKKYKSRLEQLQKDLASIISERDSLRQKIQEATNSIELIDQPFQKLTRLLASRFPEGRSQKQNEHLEEKHEANTKSQKPIWRDWLNSILLGLVLVCCCAILALILKSQEEPKEILPSDNLWDECILNISGGGQDLELDKVYSLSLTNKDGKPADVPHGHWLVYINEGDSINKGNSFTITDSIYRGKNVMIRYIVNNQLVKQRVCKIQ